MEELGDFKKPSLLKEYGTTVICAFLGGVLAFALACFISRDIRAETSPVEMIAEDAAEGTESAGNAEVDAMLADTTEDVTDLVGYTLSGMRTLTSEAGDTYTADFAADGTVTGTFVAKQMNYRVEMDNAGEMTLIFSDDDSEIPLTLNYDDSYRMVLSDDTHTYIVE